VPTPWVEKFCCPTWSRRRARSTTCHRNSKDRAHARHHLGSAKSHVEQAGEDPSVHLSSAATMRAGNRSCASSAGAIAYHHATRGYPPSGRRRASTLFAGRGQDAISVHGLGTRAHIVGLRWAASPPSACVFLSVRFRSPSPAPATAAKEFEEYFRQVSLDVADNFERQGAKEFSRSAEGASRVQFQNKDPRGWREFADRLATHRTSAMTMRGVRAHRPTATTSKRASRPWRCRRW
jgi:hypothetical protein